MWDTLQKVGLVLGIIVYSITIGGVVIRFLSKPAQRRQRQQQTFTQVANTPSTYDSYHGGGTYQPPPEFDPTISIAYPVARPKRLRVIFGWMLFVIAILLLIAAATVLVYPSARTYYTSLQAAVQPTTLPFPLFSDNFAGNSKGWATGNSKGFSETITNNTLVLVETNQNHFLPEALPNNATYGDFMVTVTFTFQQGDQNDTVGVYMRGDSNLDHDYRVDINGDNSYAIAREYLDSSNAPKQHFIVSSTPSSAIKPVGQQNTVTVIMKGSQIVLLINGTKVDSVSDTNYTSGQIYLFVAHGTTSNGTTAAFSSVAVNPLAA